MPLGRKHHVRHEDFVATLARIEELVTREELDALVALTVREVKTVVSGKRAAFGWSGGKDSVALEHVCALAGITPCVLVTTDLEFPAFDAWVAKHAPTGLETINTGQDLAWCAAHPDMVFPKTAKLSDRWSQIVQRDGHARYLKRNAFDFFLVGRRRADDNFVGKNGLHPAKGGVRYSPLRDWRHEDVFALCHYYSKPMLPCYKWPRGYVAGTGPWAGRRVPSDEVGFSEVWAIDPSVVRGAARILPQAAAYMQRHSLT
jgi:3'-phosphoadenosine 5'-phosphosulfate sulfotransferase (PAPS reductase)/FAD synthetase